MKKLSKAFMMLDAPLRILTVASLVFIVLAGVNALAQQYVLINGSSNETPPVIRKVLTDSAGRLLVSGGNTTDAGVGVMVPYCQTTASKNTTVGVTSTAVPATPLAGRWNIRVCNSPRNTGTPIITCTSDGTVPTAASTSAGDALEVGDCATYTTGSAIACISDTAATAVTSEECK